MRLRNKKTGEIRDCKIMADGLFEIKSLVDLEGWEDYEEPKSHHWYIEPRGEAIELVFGDDVEELKQELSEIGNYFETRDEAEKAVEKLKAWKRLKDKGFKFEGIRQDYTKFYQKNPIRDGRKYLQFNKSEDEEWIKENWYDLDLLFGGEE